MTGRRRRAVFFVAALVLCASGVAAVLRHDDGAMAQGAGHIVVPPTPSTFAPSELPAYGLQLTPAPAFLAPTISAAAAKGIAVRAATFLPAELRSGNPDTVALEAVLATCSDVGENGEALNPKACWVVALPPQPLPVLGLPPGATQTVVTPAHYLLMVDPMSGAVLGNLAWGS